MDFNEVLKELRNKKKQFILECKYDEVDKCNETIDKYCRLVEKYSVLDKMSLKNVINDLINTFEDEQYVCQDTYFYKIHKPAFIQHIMMYVSKVYKLENGYYDRYINSLLKKGNALILSYSDVFDRNIKIYKATEKYNLEQCIRFGKFNYVKEFIDILISYKMKYNIKKVSKEELEKLKIEFIESKINKIEAIKIIKKM